jgi:hypothetical protein
VPAHAAQLRLAIVAKPMPYARLQPPWAGGKQPLSAPIGSVLQFGASLSQSIEQPDPPVSVTPELTMLNYLVMQQCQIVIIDRRPRLGNGYATTRLFCNNP